MADTQQPLISVKKIDGTLVKMTLDEFRVYKAQKSQAAPAQPVASGIDPNTLDGAPLRPNVVVTPNIPPVPQLAPKEVHNLPMVEESLSLSSATPTIVGDLIKDLTPSEETEQNQEIDSVQNEIPEEANQLQQGMIPSMPEVPSVESLPKEKMSSPLEELSEEEKTIMYSPVSNLNETLTQEIITPIAFLVEKEVEPKLHALVLSRVKEIRTEEQVKELAMASIDKGGLGLDEMKVNILLHAIDEAMQKKPAAALMPSAQARLKPVVPPVATINKAELKPVTLSPASPPQNTKPDAHKILSSLIAEDRIQAEIMKPTFTRIDTGKVQMQDVVARQTSMGPVDEMMNFSLVDFRRLGANPEASAGALIQKFSLLKTDSYLLFLNGRNAWFKSPLYSGYLEILQQSLATRRPIAAVLSTEKDALKIEEIQAIVRVSQSLNL